MSLVGKVNSKQALQGVLAIRQGIDGKDGKDGEKGEQGEVSFAYANSHYSPAIISSASGEVVTTTDSAKAKPKNIKLFGKSEQDGTPSIEASIEIQSHGDSGSIVGKVLSGNLLGSYDVRESYGICCKVDNGINHLYGTAKQDTTFVWVIGGYTQTQEELTLEAGTYSIEDNYQIHSYDGSVRNTYRGTFTINEKISVTGILYEATFVQGTTYDKYIEIMFNVGDSLKEFEPYTEQPFTALTPNGLRGIPLGQTIPDAIKNSPIHMAGVYWDKVTSQYYIGDTVEFESREYVQRIWELGIDDFDVSVTGDTGWYNSDQSYSYELKTDGLLDNCYAKDMSTHFTGYGFNEFYNAGVENGCLTGHSYMVVNISKSLGICTTIDEFKQWCIDNDVKFAKILADPIITDLTKEELDQYNALLMNYPNTTVVNDVGAYMEVEYVADTKCYIDNKFKEMQANLVSATAQLL